MDLRWEDRNKVWSTWNSMGSCWLLPANADESLDAGYLSWRYWGGTNGYWYTCYFGDGEQNPYITIYTYWRFTSTI